MSRLDNIIEAYYSRNVGNRVPTKEDVVKAYRDGMQSVKKGSWNVDGMPKGRKPVAGLFFSPDHEIYIRMIDPEDFGNLFAGNMVAWAYVSSLVSTKSVLDDARNR